MSVHYKFKSALEYSTLPVDGVNISVEDLKEAIIEQKKLSKAQPFDLIITNAETMQEYTDEKALIPKNSSLLVARVPVSAQNRKAWINAKEPTTLLLSNPANLMNTEDAGQVDRVSRFVTTVADLTRMTGSEEDRINAMMAQSTLDYHPSRYVKLPKSRMAGKVPPNYSCYKCSSKGAHWPSNCPLSNTDLRRSYGIPSDQLRRVTDPNTPGVMVTAKGTLVVYKNAPEIDLPAPPSEDVRVPIPEELQCGLCEDLVKDAVLIPCCAVPFCDECIHNHLIESDDNQCPKCLESSVNIDKLIPSLYHRRKAVQFDRDTNGNYIRGFEKHYISPPASVAPLPPHLRTSTQTTPAGSPKNKDHGSAPEKPPTSGSKRSPAYTSSSNDLAINSPDRKLESNKENISADLHQNSSIRASPVVSPKMSFKDKDGESPEMYRGLLRDVEEHERETEEKRRKAAEIAAGQAENEKHKKSKKKKEKKKKEGKEKRKDKHKHSRKSSTDEKGTENVPQSSTPQRGRKRERSTDSTSSDDSPSRERRKQDNSISELYNVALTASCPLPSVSQPAYPTCADPYYSQSMFSVPPPGFVMHPMNAMPVYVQPQYQNKIIDDPLAAFNKHLQEQDERRRREQMRRQQRSPSPYSRYHRRSWSRSPDGSRRMRRSPSPRGRRFRWSRSRSPVSPRHYLTSIRPGSPRSYRDSQRSPASHRQYRSPSYGRQLKRSPSSRQRSPPSGRRGSPSFGLRNPSPPSRYNSSPAIRRRSPPSGRRHSPSPRRDSPPSSRKYMSPLGVRRVSPPSGRRVTPPSYRRLLESSPHRGTAPHHHERRESPRGSRSPHGPARLKGRLSPPLPRMATMAGVRPQHLLSSGPPEWASSPPRQGQASSPLRRFEEHRIETVLRGAPEHKDHFKSERGTVKDRLRDPADPRRFESKDRPPADPLPEPDVSNRGPPRDGRKYSGSPNVPYDKRRSSPLHFRRSSPIKPSSRPESRERGQLYRKSGSASRSPPESQRSQRRRYEQEFFDHRYKSGEDRRRQKVEKGDRREQHQSPERAKAEKFNESSKIERCSRREEYEGRQRSVDRRVAERPNASQESNREDEISRKRSRSRERLRRSAERTRKIDRFGHRDEEERRSKRRYEDSKERNSSKEKEGRRDEKRRKIDQSESKSSLHTASTHSDKKVTISCASTTEQSADDSEAKLESKDKSDKDKRKKDKKKKKKEKRERSSQQSENSQNESVDDESKKKRDKKDSEVVKTCAIDIAPKVEMAEVQIAAAMSAEVVVKETSERTVMFSPSLLPEPSKWEREEDGEGSSFEVAATPDSAPPGRALVTSEVIRKAESALFNSRGMLGRVLLPKKMHEMEREREFEAKRMLEEPDFTSDKKSEGWEAKRRGASIQITISSKTETDIGRRKVESDQFADLACADQNSELFNVNKSEDSKPFECDREVKMSSNEVSSTVTELNESATAATQVPLEEAVACPTTSSLIFASNTDEKCNPSTGSAEELPSSTVNSSECVASNEDVEDGELVDPAGNVVVAEAESLISSLVKSSEYLLRKGSTELKKRTEASTVAASVLETSLKVESTTVIASDAGVGMEVLEDKTEAIQTELTPFSAPTFSPPVVTKTSSTVEHDSKLLELPERVLPAENFDFAVPSVSDVNKELNGEDYDKKKKRKKRKRSLSESSSSSSSTESSESDSDSEEEKRKKRKKNKKKARKHHNSDSDSSYEKTKKKRKKDKKKRKKKDKKKKKIKEGN